MARFRTLRALASVETIGRTLVFAALAVASNSVYAASFDCARASSEIDKAVCANGALSSLDEKLARAFTDALKTNDQEPLRREQRVWLRKRDSACNWAIGSNRFVQCLMWLYQHRIALLESLSRMPRDPGLTLLRSTDEYWPNALISMRHGRLVFSQYARSGNAHDVVALDPATGAAETLVSEVNNPIFLDENDSIVALSYTARFTIPVGIFERKTGRLLRHKGLRKRILAGRILGDRLVAVQPGEGVVFDLKNLRVLSSVALPPTNRAYFLRDDRILVVTPAKALLYDAEFNQIGELPAPVRPRLPLISCGIEFGGLVGAHIVLVRNCGDIVVYDLASRAIETIIPRSAAIVSVAAVGDLIVSLDTNAQRPDAEARIYDLHTGEELEVLELPAQRLAAIPGGFAALDGYSIGGFQVLHFFALNEAAVRDTATREGRLIRTNERLAVAVPKPDVYAQISALERGGIGGFVWRLNAGKPISAAVESGLWRYAELMAHTLTRLDEAAALLGALSARDPGDATLVSLLATAKARADWLEHGEPRALAGKFSHPEPRPAGMIQYEPDLVVRSDKDRVYVMQRDCGPDRDKPSLRLDAFDRKSMRRIGVAAIAACEDPDFPRPGNVDLVQGHMITSSPITGHTVGEAGTPVIVVDTRSLAVTRHGMDSRPGVSYLFSEDGALYCDCSTSLCARFDVPTWRKTASTVAAPEDLPCPGKEQKEEECFHCPSPPDPQDVEGYGRLLGVSEHYAVFESRHGGMTGLSTLLFVRVDGAPGAPVAVPLVFEFFRGFLGDGRSILVMSRLNDTVYLRMIQLEDGRVTTLLDFKPRYHGIPAIAYGANVFVGYGRDLYVYDTARGKLSWFEKNFVDGVFRDNCCGIDLNEIAAFRVADGKLLVVNFWNDRTRSLDVQQLLGGIERPD